MKGVELFSFLGDGNTYVAKEHALLQTHNTDGLDSVLADLKQQVHDAFGHNGGVDSVDNSLALLHLTHHE